MALMRSAVTTANLNPTHSTVSGLNPRFTPFKRSCGSVVVRDWYLRRRSHRASRRWLFHFLSRNSHSDVRYPTSSHVGSPRLYHLSSLRSTCPPTAATWMAPTPSIADMRSSGHGMPIMPAVQNTSSDHLQLRRRFGYKTTAIHQHSPYLKLHTLNYRVIHFSTVPRRNHKFLISQIGK